MTSLSAAADHEEADPGPLESIAFAGLAPGPKLIVIGAVHGNETCGPLAIARVIDEIRAGRIPIRRGEVTFVPVANPKAYLQNTREGERNLNRDLYEKPVARNYEDRIGNRLCALLRRHEVLLDIHSFSNPAPPFVFFGPQDNAGELEPFRHGQAERDFAACLGTKVLIHGWLDIYARLIAARETLQLPPLALTEGFGTTEFMRFAGGYGVTLECGVHDDPNGPEIGYRAIRNALAQLALVDEPKPEPALPTVIEMNDLVICERDGDRLDGEWRTCDPVEAGAVVARRADGSAVQAQRDGFIIFPNATAKPGEGICYLGVASAR